MTELDHPLALGTLAAYRLGELTPEEEERVEAHYFECSVCAERLQFIESLAQQVGGLLREGRISAAVTAAFVDLAAKRGINLRSYELDIGGSVACTAAPDDDFIITRLAVPLPAGTPIDLETEFADLTTGRTSRFVTPDLSVDAEGRGLVYAFSADAIRAYPKSRVVIRVRERASGTEFGPYTLHHTPWDERVQD
jgi:hypothetical protein